MTTIHLEYFFTLWALQDVTGLNISLLISKLNIQKKQKKNT